MPKPTTQECPRAADVFLYSMNELGPWDSARAAVHLARCGTCRTEIKRLKRASGQIRKALGPNAIVERPFRAVALRGALVVAATAGIVGLWFVGNAAVRSARGATANPTYQTASQEGNNNR